ncbi:hypothetical protein ACH4TQ_02975 [Streptomyces sp. NPDC021218]|uniref:hypothetical protein n=1 Tax=Streptomyces sp. NPDC021218 TaxID=3365119 RepID=UPI0037A78019
MNFGRKTAGILSGGGMLLGLLSALWLDHHDSLASAAVIRDMVVSTAGGGGGSKWGRTAPLMVGELVIQTAFPVPVTRART